MLLTCVKTFFFLSVYYLCSHRFNVRFSFLARVGRFKWITLLWTSFMVTEVSIKRPMLFLIRPTIFVRRQATDRLTSYSAQIDTNKKRAYRHDETTLITIIHDIISLSIEQNLNMIKTNNIIKSKTCALILNVTLF